MYLSLNPSRAKSLLGLYEGKGRWDRDRIFASFVSPERHRLNIRCIRTDRYKFVHHLTTDEVELYDLEKDPYELANLAGQPQFETLQNQLAGELLAWRKKSENQLEL